MTLIEASQELNKAIENFKAECMKLGLVRFINRLLYKQPTRRD